MNTRSEKYDLLPTAANGRTLTVRPRVSTGDVMIVGPWFAYRYLVVVVCSSRRPTRAPAETYGCANTFSRNWYVPATTSCVRRVSMVEKLWPIVCPPGEVIASLA